MNIPLGSQTDFIVKGHIPSHIDSIQQRNTIPRFNRQCNHKRCPVRVDISQHPFIKYHQADNIFIQLRYIVQSNFHSPLLYFNDSSLSEKILYRRMYQDIVGVRLSAPVGIRIGELQCQRLIDMRKLHFDAIDKEPVRTAS